MLTNVLTDVATCDLTHSTNHVTRFNKQLSWIKDSGRLGDFEQSVQDAIDNYLIKLIDTGNTNVIGETT